VALKFGVYLMPTVSRLFFHQSSRKMTATLIFLHGLGDTGHGWESILKTTVPKYFKVVCPTAPTQPVTLNSGMRMPSWFDIRGLSIDAEQDRAGITNAAESLQKLIENEVKNGVPEERIVIGCFSQGGAVALYHIITNSKNPRLGGCVGLSTWFPLHKEVLSNPTMHRTRKDVPIFMGHGTADPLIPLAMGSMSHELLKGGLGLERSEFKSYSGVTHSSCDEELKDVRVFLEKAVPESKKIS
jgi:predicted esterase